MAAFSLLSVLLKIAKARAASQYLPQFAAPPASPPIRVIYR
jgi:hypothetical protein